MTHGPGPEERAAIDDLYASYLWALDTRDEDAYAATFFDDAELIEEPPGAPMTRDRGADAVRRFVRAFWSRHEPGHQHRETTRIYLPDPEGRSDHWAVKAYVFATEFDESSYLASVYWSGYYRDVIAKRDGRWGYVSRWIAGWQGDAIEGFTHR